MSSNTVKDAWFRSNTWNPEDQVLFEQKLSQSRTAYNKSQYMRLKGLALQESNNIEVREAGRQLFLRVLSEYPDHSAKALTYEELGRSYQRDGNIVFAEKYLRLGIEAQKEHPVYLTRCALLLSELIIESKQISKFNEIPDLLSEWGRNFRPLFNSDQFRFCVAFARCADVLHEKETAVLSATKALELAEIGEKPQFSRHKTIGLVHTDEKTLSKMRVIIQKYSKTKTV